MRIRQRILKAKLALANYEMSSANQAKYLYTNILYFECETEIAALYKIQEEKGILVF